MTKKREIELDLLRLLALVAVISVHVSGINTDMLSFDLASKKVLTVFGALSTWQVPVYVMISGRFFLDHDRQVDNQKIKRAIKRIALAYLVWNVLYQIFYISTGIYVGLNWKGIICQAIQGPYHFWFLFMICGLYVITPILRKICEDKKLMELFIILFFIFEGWYYCNELLPSIGSILQPIYVSIGFKLAMGFSGYYVLGYYLKRYPLSDKKELIVYILALIFFIAVSILTVNRSVEEGVNDEWYTQYLMPNVAIEAIAIYTFFVKRVSKAKIGGKTTKVVGIFADCSFGIYLVHALVADVIGKTGISAVTVSPFLMMPVLIVATLIISLIIVIGIRKIPVLGKRIT